MEVYKKHHLTATKTVDNLLQYINDPIKRDLRYYLKDEDLKFRDRMGTIKMSVQGFKIGKLPDAEELLLAPADKIFSNHYVSRLVKRMKDLESTIANFKPINQRFFATVFGIAWFTYSYTLWKLYEGFVVNGYEYPVQVGLESRVYSLLGDFQHFIDSCDKLDFNADIKQTDLSYIEAVAKQMLKGQSPILL